MGKDLKGKELGKGITKRKDASLQMTMDLYTSVMEQKKTEDMKLLEDTIGLDKVNENSTVRNNKIIQFA